MRKYIAFAVCILTFNTVFAQFPEVPPPVHVTVIMEKGKPAGAINYIPQKPKNGFKKNAIGGTFTDMRKQPIKGVRAFIYLPDSSIGASGFTDAKGYYETNSIAPGTYDLRIVYPNSKKTTKIMSIPVLQGYITDISFRKTEAPAEDTVIEFRDIAPKIEDKKKK
jgi:hypothetical protein